MATKLKTIPETKYDKNNRSNYAYLLFVDGVSNKNKFFEISENAETKDVLTHYGRVGMNGVYMEYKASEEKGFQELKDEKENRGYIDKTALFSNKTTVSNQKEKILSFSKPVDDLVVQRFLEGIIKASKQFMKENYTIETSDITLKMIKEAQSHIDNLTDICANNNVASVYQFNNELQELFETIPRSMKNVSDHLAHSSSDCLKIINRETEMLNNIRGILKARGIENTTLDKDKKTIPETYGLKVKRATYRQEDEITQHLGRDYNGHVERRFVRAFAVENNETRQNYEQYKKDNNINNKKTKLFYHGSKMENWFSICNQGLSLNPQAKITGKMFGQGLYFAPECRKALNYMDTVGSHWCQGATRNYGYTAVFAVAVGTAYQPDRVLGDSFTQKDLKLLKLKNGENFGSVFASKKNPNLRLLNDEYIVYDQNACTIKYMLEMQSSNARELEFNLDRNNLRNQLIDHTSPLAKIDDNKYRAEIFIEQIPAEIKTQTKDGEEKILCKPQEAFNQIINPENCQNLYVEYDCSTNKINFIINDNTGTEREYKPNITKDDYAFIMREMKKNFAVGEYEWELVIKEGKNKDLGYYIPTINGTNNDREQSLDIERTM